MFENPLQTRAAICGTGLLLGIIFFLAHLPAILLMLGLVFGSYPSLASGELLAQTIFRFFPQIDFSQGYHVIGGAMMLLAVVLSPAIQNLLNKNWLGSLGHISYSVFTLHFLVLGSFSSFVYYVLYSKIGHNGAALVSIALSIPLILLLAKYAARYVDDNFSRLADWIGAKSAKFFASLAVRMQTGKPNQ